MDDAWVEFMKVAGAHLLAVASPGPDFAIVLRQSLRHGHRAAIWTSIGVGTAILLHVSYSLLGIGWAINRSPFWFNILKYSGAAYLAWLGIQALRTKPKADASIHELGDAPVPTNRSAFVTGFLTNALNLKATLFFVALFVTVISPATPKHVQLGYGLWMSFATTVWFCCVATLFTLESVRRPFLRHGHWIDRILGAVFIGFAVSLLLAARTTIAP